jgi:hypothetical protein
MMLGKVVDKIVNTASPVIEELALVDAVPDPVKMHVNYLRGSLFGSFIGSTSCTCIVFLHLCGTLWVSYL